MRARLFAVSPTPAEAGPAADAPSKNASRGHGKGHAGRAHFWRAALAGLAAFWGGLAALVVIAPLA